MTSWVKFLWQLNLILKVLRLVLHSGVLAFQEKKQLFSFWCSFWENQISTSPTDHRLTFNETARPESISSFTPSFYEIQSPSRVLTEANSFTKVDWRKWQPRTPGHQGQPMHLGINCSAFSACAGSHTVGAGTPLSGRYYTLSYVPLSLTMFQSLSNLVVSQAL